MPEDRKTLTRHTIEMEQCGNYLLLFDPLDGSRIGAFVLDRDEAEAIERYYRAHAEPSTDDFSLFNTRSLFRA